MGKSVEQLIDTLLYKGIKDETVLQAIRQVPREEFVAKDWAEEAYSDLALPFAHGQTISQPYVVARMSELLRDGKPLNKVLEIGTGTGYQAAVLSHLAQTVYSIERIESLYLVSKMRLKSYPNIKIKFGDGYLGWPEHAPFDGIIVTAAAETLPQALVDQLADGGRMVIPLGDGFSQILTVIEKKLDQITMREYDPVRFVPMLTGKDED